MACRGIINKIGRKMDKKKILVIDDEEASTQMLKTSLECSGAYAVIVTYDGDEGLKKIAEEDPDVVILDVMMPGRFLSAA